MHTRYVLRHRRGSLFVSRLRPEGLTFPMETLAVIHASSESEARNRASLVRESIAAAGQGYLPGPDQEFARVA